MRLIMTLGLGLALLTVGVAAKASERELGAHQHGHAVLNMAIEGNAMLVELEAPGADIVGFEYAAGTSEEKEAVAAALADLGKPEVSITIPAAAGCVVESASAELEGGQSHSEFHAEYIFACANPEAIDRLSFGYFERFQRSRELQVNVIAGQVQRSYEVGRAAPELNLEGLR